MADDISLFINAGWYTVPLQGELKRLPDGKKTIPKYPEGWRDKYAEHRNTDVTAIGGVITGERSGIIAIDCDSPEAYAIFRALDPEYDCIFVSRGKQFAGRPVDAGTIIYKYHADFAESFSVRNGTFNVDYYGDRGFVYLPTRANDTKEPWDRFIQPKDIPASVAALLRTIKPNKLEERRSDVAVGQHRFHLAPQVEQFVRTQVLSPALFRILTPRDFRNTEQYALKGFLHPADVVEGRGSEYLSKVSAILGADPSIDEELYCKAMRAINNLFKEPMRESRLASTIMEPMIEERAKINGEPIWKYDPAWKDKVVVVPTKKGDQLDVFFDMHRREYFAADTLNEKVYTFSKDSDLTSFLDVVSVEPVVKADIKRQMPLVTVVSTPQYLFGYIDEHKERFNLFRNTVPLTVFKDPSVYKSHYSYPAVTLAYFESLVPDNASRNYLLKFLRRKFDKFEYSPVVLYFLGVSGSGKDMFVELLEHIIGSEAIAKPTAKEFLEKHNGWMLDSYFAQLDEYGDQLTRYEDKEEAKGRIKAWSGKANVSIREMRADSAIYPNNVTFILTANKQPLTFDMDDRRIFLIETPQRLKDAPMVKELGIEVFRKRLFADVNNFMYWLATERDNLTLEEYTTPPDTEQKRLMVASKLNAGERIAFLLQSQLFEELDRLATDAGVENLFHSHKENRVYEDELYALYMELTDGKGTKRGLTAAMQKFDKVPTTYQGAKAYYYRVPGLFQYRGRAAMTPIEGDFD